MNGRVVTDRVKWCAGKCFGDVVVGLRVRADGVADVSECVHDDSSDNSGDSNGEEHHVCEVAHSDFHVFGDWACDKEYCDDHQQDLPDCCADRTGGICEVIFEVCENAVCSDAGGDGDDRAGERGDEHDDEGGDNSWIGLTMCNLECQYVLHDFTVLRALWCV